ncbi:MAG TPA: hypothetical protein VE758_03510 [Chthoniobacterales bacterium]|nr:hypothetical protein [Chthoniobacterales bacterium]
MKSQLAILLLSILLTCRWSAGAESDREVEARKHALELAGAFTNDGFKMRDGHWCGMLRPHDMTLIAVNLYAGNQYWFSVGAVEPAKKVGVNLYDEAGKQVPTEKYDSGDKAAAGFSPSSSGQYFVAVDLLEGTESNYCLVYSYK